MNKIFDVEILHELNIMDSFLKKLIKMALLQNGPSVDEKENNLSWICCHLFRSLASLLLVHHKNFHYTTLLSHTERSLQKFDQTGSRRWIRSKNICFQAQWPEVPPQNPDGRRRKLTPERSSLTSTHVSQHTCAHMGSKYIHELVNK